MRLVKFGDNIYVNPEYVISLKYVQDKSGVMVTMVRLDSPEVDLWVAEPIDKVAAALMDKPMSLPIQLDISIGADLDALGAEYKIPRQAVELDGNYAVEADDNYRARIKRVYYGH
jgi:hypothetical protein